MEKTTPITADMLRALEAEAGNAGDTKTKELAHEARMYACPEALQSCCDVINAARAMDPDRAEVVA